MLAVPDSGRIVVVDVLESPQIIRTAPYVGMVISFEDSASGAALLSPGTKTRNNKNCSVDL